MKLYQQKIQTPLGTMVACANENGLCLFDFEDTKNLDKELLQVSEKLQSTIYEEENTILKQTFLLMILNHSSNNMMNHYLVNQKHLLLEKV